ncbi:transposase [Aquimarina sp. 2201CG1-2-11]|uniref:transposase n=1 Tax=Aquimarina discodermiae TaxID=3231043 RepID=UPI003461BE7E
MGENHPQQQSKGAKRKPIRHHKPKIKNMDHYLLQIFQGKDATVLPGITDYNWLQLLSEIGTDLQRWKTAKHFTSWLGLAPKQHHSGRMRKNYKPKGQPKAGLIFKQAATSLLNSKKIAIGAFGRKIRARKGPSLAIKAMARKLAELYWKLFTKGLAYVEKGIQSYNEKIMINKQKHVIKMAKELGMSISYKTTS